MRTLSERFWQKVEKSDGCWLWRAHLDHGGYGKFWVIDQMRAAHRVSYELLVGEIPKGLTLDHLCRHRNCVNPDHLEPVTHRVNILRGEGVAASEAAQTHCIHGHPFDEKNTYIRTRGRGRDCRTCHAIWNRAYRKRKKNAAFST